MTRFVLDVSDNLSFSISMGENNQIFVDLPELDWQSTPRTLAKPVGVLRTFRYSPLHPGAGRLELTTMGPTMIRKAFMLLPGDKSGYRLVIDLIDGAALPPAAAPKPHIEAAEPPKPSESAIPLPRTDKSSGKKNKNKSAPVSEPRGNNDGRKSNHPGKPIVMIDPGHGGVDPGAISLTGAFEKNIVLGLATELKRQLDKNGKVQCLLTRDHDEFIPLRQRVAIARMAKADLFMSLHADSVADSTISGLSVYTLSQTASDSEAQALADKENKADIVAGIDFSKESPEVANILIDLVQRESMNLSSMFAQTVISEVRTRTHMLLGNTHRFAGFAVLKAPDVPSVLVESGYLSNAHDERMLRQPEYRIKLAEALARAIERYFVRIQTAGHR